MNKSVSHRSKKQFDRFYPPDLALSVPVGIGLRAPHYQELLDTKPSNIGWLEVHPENYFCGGMHKHFLDELSQHYPLSMHGVGLSLGADQAVDEKHLKAFKELIDRYNPFLVSDHVSWSASGNAHLNDLLPLPYTSESLARLSQNINQTQDYFERAMLVENPSTYIAFKDNEMPEYDFMNALCETTGCGMILDVNNIYVQSHNHGLDPYAYIDAIHPDYVEEIHLAGHIEKEVGEHSILVDTHNKRVCDDVWDLYAHAIKRTGSKPTLIEWDQDFPTLQVLLDEADLAHTIIKNEEPS